MEQLTHRVGDVTRCDAVRMEQLTHCVGDVTRMILVKGLTKTSPNVQRHFSVVFGNILAIKLAMHVRLQALPRTIQQPGKRVPCSVSMSDKTPARVVTPVSTQYQLKVTHL